jgi:WhiB family redox-sensing transcriptional regulator
VNGAPSPTDRGSAERGKPNGGGGLSATAQSYLAKPVRKPPRRTRRPERRDDVSWMGSALCAQIGPEFWYPPVHPESAVIRVCGRCGVREQCLAYALEHDERQGVWGGLTTRARDRIRNGGDQ